MEHKETTKPISVIQKRVESLNKGKRHKKMTYIDLEDILTE